MKPALVINCTKMNEIYNNKNHEEILKFLMFKINVCKNASNFYLIFSFRWHSNVYKCSLPQSLNWLVQVMTTHTSYQDSNTRLIKHMPQDHIGRKTNRLTVCSESLSSVNDYVQLQLLPVAICKTIYLLKSSMICFLLILT